MPYTRVITRKPKVEFRSLAKEEPDLHGYCYKSLRQIVIDTRIPNRTEAEIIIHEHLHNAFPGIRERDIAKIAGVIGDSLWNRGYRRIKKK